MSLSSQWTTRLSGYRKGFFALCVFELLSRFAFYMLLGVLVIYVEIDERGLQLRGQGNGIYGAYLALVFFTPVFGGVLATRWLGLRRAIFIGGVLFALGLVLVGIGNVTSLYSGLILLCLGNGLTRPGISLLVGNLYPTTDEKHDIAFSILFFFINTGAFIAFIAASPIRIMHGWQWVFWLAAIGMVSGVIVLVANWRRLESGDHTLSHDPKRGKDLAEFTKKLLLPAAGFAGLGYTLSKVVTFWPRSFSGATTSVVFGMVPVIVFLVSLYWRAPVPERPRIYALLIVFLAAASFFSIFHAHGTAFTTWAKDKTDREVSWMPRGWLTDTESDYFAPSPDRADGMNQTNSSQSPGSSSGSKKKVVHPDVYQAWNPFWVIVFTPLVVAFFRRREVARRPISTARKIFFGLVLTMLSMLLMIGAAWVYDLGEVRVSGLWLVGMYGIITLGEVFLTPMGQSIVTKLAPERLAGVLMGGWYCSMAIGNVISGVLGEVHTKLPPTIFFLVLALAMGLVAALFWRLLPRLDQALR